MEVDDAIVIDTAGEKTVLHGGIDGNSDNEQTTASTSSKHKRAKLKHGKEEPPGALEVENSDSGLMAASFKLEVSASDDERGIDGDDAIGRKLLLTPMEEDTAAKDGLQELDGVVLKRKRYDVRRSGSEECLLGFDEQSGEAELVKPEALEEHPDLPANRPIENVEEQRNIGEVAIENRLHSPKCIKKVSPVRKIASPSLHLTRSASKSPKALKPKTPPVEMDQISKPVQKSPPKPHIVADGEDINGVLPTPIKPNSQGLSKKQLSPQDDFYKKPFEYGWKRELVWRANPEQSKDKADVYFISPAGKKMRGRNEIISLLEGDLTIDHFCFMREPLGASPDVEIVRSAKPSSRATVTAATLAAASTPSTIGKRISKPKGPKGASPPPQGWTASKALKVNNAALLSSTGSVGRSTTAYHAVPNTPPSSRKHDAAVQSTHSAKASKTKKSAANRTETETKTVEVRKASSAIESKEPCTVGCTKAQGQVPQLQCIKCLCLHHHECVGLNQSNSGYRTTISTTGKDYICEACIPKSMLKPSPASNSLPPIIKPASTMVYHKRPENKFPQTIAVVKGKKYVMVAKSLTLSNEHVNDIENDLKQINESIRKNRKQSNNSLDGSLQATNAHNSLVVDHSNKLFATNFFANVSYAYDSLLCILKYLKIHERPRAAAVCKLWNLAAKDTSLWQTVRMKNSKVCSWFGFAGALRRGETKHLDLRKMLLSGGRSEDMWNDFCANIGTVCSLETIDLCRCSARVVESLFQSNRNLKVINALAINDDTINLEHIGLLKSLEELRIRTCESGVLTGDLSPISSLSALTHVSLTSIKGLGAKAVEVLGELTTLKSLELGECGDFDSTFAEAVLPKLMNLQRLRLENSQVTNVCTLEILDAVARLEQLNQLELVNFDIKPGFDGKLSLCMNITKLLIIPTYISQSATTNQIVLSAVQQVSETLKVFTWCVTVELLRVTALYVDQCEESTKKEKHHFDECIPVLKPVPGATTGEENEQESIKPKSPIAAGDGNGATEVPQIEILPLDKVESILAENLPHTKFTIVKVPYHATCKQQLVESN